MDKIVTENLFLLEFLVDCVNLDKCLCRGVGDIAGDTCVSLQFLDNPPLEICEDEYSSKNKYSRDSNNVKSGKSCLFSLTPAQAEEAVEQFDVCVRIYKKMKPGIMPGKIPIGNSLISIVNLFNELLASVNVPCTECHPTPSAKTLKDVFQITNQCGTTVGDFGMYVRMSCFGKLIVTQFQMNLDDKSVLFKDKEGHSLYRYKKAGKGDAETDRKSISGKRAVAIDACCPNVAQPRPCYHPACPPCDPPCAPPCPPPRLPAPPPPCPSFSGGPCSVCTQEAPCNTVVTHDNSCYQEIGAALGGNALKIRVLKEKKLEKVDTEEDTCTCTPSYISTKAPRCSAGGCQLCQPCCAPYEQNIVMRPGCEDTNGNSPFSLKVGGCCSPCGNNNVCVVPPVCTASDGTQFTEISDPNKDVFILRIGKKSEGADRKKNNLELELCTPKGPDIKPIPRKESRDTQCEDGDGASKGRGGGKDGGKNGGKNGGKGKKKGKCHKKKRSSDGCGGAVTHFIGECCCRPCTPCSPCTRFSYSCTPCGYSCCKPVGCRYWC